MSMYYIEHEEKIVLFDEDKQKLQDTLAFMPQFSADDIKETDRPIVDFQFADTPQYSAAQQAKADAERIEELKGLLADTDYKAIKYAEGIISEEEYADTRAQRQAWRSEINELEGAEDDRAS